MKAQPVTIAVAANFKTTAEALAKDYQLTNTQFTYRISSASTGILYNQIKHGAPFDLFFSADDLRPQQLVNEQHAIKQKPYAVGQLVFWAPQFTDQNGEFVKGEALWNKWSEPFAYANPELAPYGAAAQQLVSEKNASQKIILANNVSQVYQFIVTGNVKAGFVARSIKTDLDGSFWVVPKNRHPAVTQNMALLTNKSQAVDFYHYLSSSAAHSIIKENGYLLP
ncbi:MULTISPECIES: molybdate ABC transporter substrate-binding protein [unclassified Agarivorans]|uniref:molybdate ABC transporter substrate-binding protein n=1 Tax=unclassified Agarivorans TaxID=2636026 RepID=UPI0026E18BD1|nr:MULTISPECIES: molybdate ABC transporter substrate-binding protein [unclassified Agarivorans]MDO6686024.1 molybdate ABC transporter substrate-binding protein [Agarivorans sp. 3_MG-2023]MDO6713838.1 molybdate ABC transporter substrate-binding protein [Agarivorans sp. 2_MG-2023]